MAARHIPRECAAPFVETGKCIYMNQLHKRPVNDCGGLKCRASERRAELVQAMPSAAEGAYLYERLCKTPGKWLGRAVSPNVAHSPGQRLGKT